MTSRLKKSLVAVWLIVASITMGYRWYNYPDSFPKIPEGFANWSVDFFHANTQEEVADLELLFCLFVFAIFVRSLTFLALYLWRRVSKPR